MIEKYTTAWSDDSIRHIHNADREIKKHFLYVQEAGDFKTLPGYYTERENLPSYLILYTLSGCGELDYEGRHFRLMPETAVCLDCMKHHIYKTAEEWNFLWVHFSGTTAADYTRTVNQEGLKICRGEDRTEAQMRRILALSMEGNRAADIRTASLLTSVLTGFILQRNRDGTAKDPVPETVKHVQHYLDRHCLEEISLEDLSRRFGLSRSYLCRQFRRFTGVTVLGYCQNLRLSYAKELLRTTDFPIARIAETCGHPHVSHFIEAFRKREGVTPLVYRKMWSDSREEAGKNK
ncbi:MAG: AraC family transcriptional regulator [Eubacterium sp.]|nr:AraC family transcriptional regulator [Eubacterium sp.]